MLDNYVVLKFSEVILLFDLKSNLSYQDLKSQFAGFLLEKNLREGEDNRQLFLKQSAIVSIVRSIVLKILGEDAF